MLTEKEVDSLKVGDVIYWVDYDDEGELGCFMPEITSIDSISIYCGGFQFLKKHPNLFKNKKDAYHIVIADLNDQIKSLLESKSIYEKQLEQENE